MLRPRDILVCGAALLAGCGGVSDPVRPIAGEGDAYAITERRSPLEGGAQAAARAAADRAEAWCRSRHRRFVPIRQGEIGWPGLAQVMGATGVELTFRCVSADAPTYTGTLPGAAVPRTSPP